MAIIGNPLTIGGGSGGIDTSTANSVVNAFATMSGSFCLDVTDLWDGIFSGNEVIGGVDLQNLVTIPAHAFEGCTSMSYIYAPSVTSVGECAFSGCTSLETCGLTTDYALDIAPGAFYGCGALSGFYQLSAAVSIGSYAFAMASDAVNSVAYGMDATWYNTSYVGDHAFECNPYVGQMTFNSVEHIGSYAFADTNLSTATIDATSVSLSEAFANCTNLCSAVISAQTVTDMTSTFAGCTSLENVCLYCATVPSGIETAFYGCAALSAVYVDSSLLDAYVAAVPSMSTIFTA